jgi:hypothetical protein
VPDKETLLRATQCELFFAGRQVLELHKKTGALSFLSLRRPGSGRARASPVRANNAKQGTHEGRREGKKSGAFEWIRTC